MTRAAVWTIGHSNRSFEDFALGLKSESIDYVVDVRSYPYSRYASQFNREELQAGLPAYGMDYRFLGEALGGRPPDSDHYDEDGRALYAEMAKAPAFCAKIDSLVAGARRHRIALVCSEGNPRDCHRRLLVGRALTLRGVELRHILPDGSVWVEGSVALPEHVQASLFGENAQPWRSTRSVSHRRRLNGSSAA